MDPHSLKILDFDKVKELLAARASSELGKKAVFSLEPLSCESEIKRLLQEATEAKELITIYPEFSPGFTIDIGPVLANAKIEGAILALKELWETGRFLHAAKSCRNFLFKERQRAKLLFEIAKGIADLSALEESIKKSINKDGEIFDDASPALKRIRQRSRELRSRIRSSLEAIIKNNPEVVQEHFVALRDGRYVLPLLPMFRRKIEGIIHGQSSSGATLYVEPYSVVKLNNEIAELSIEEEKEMRRILAHLSGMVRHSGQDLERSAAAFSQIDLAYAKGQFSIDFECVEPELSKDGEIYLYGARHPILQENYKKTLSAEEFKEKIAVPIDICLGADYISLLITGPNTGGKTVALKTAGILHAMAHAGVHIPAKESSKIAVLNNIYADIGDEQSIEQNLSTFSSHIKNISRIVKESNSSSLVLLDELGSGTEPSEGGAIGIAILDYLQKKRVKTIATTHHNSLKTYSYSRPGVQCATVEFDEETLRPLYKLKYGLPGSSKAILVAGRLGLPQAIIEVAQHEEAEGKEHLQWALEKMERQRKTLDEEIQKARATASALAALEQECRSIMERLKSERKKASQQVRLKGEKFLAEARHELSAIISSLKKEGCNPKTAAGAIRKIDGIKEKFDEINHEHIDEGAEPSSGDIQAGCRVRLKSLGIAGVVEEGPTPEGMVNIRVGQAIMKVAVREIALVQTPEQLLKKLQSEKQRGSFGIDFQRPEAISPEINVIGCRAEEALKRIDKYLDDAALAGLTWVRIVHGKGTGRLRQAVAGLLKDHPLVKSFGSEVIEKGGAGVTTVDLNI